ncbi:MAG TPA: serine/threonine-protein kinase [Gemmataceae bacterium]|nr:serine/threonine-protein kinase [Gemmataceae bacterium]
MPVPSSCPPSERLRQLLAEEPPAEEGELVAHVDECPACQRRLEQLAGADAPFLRAATSLQSVLHAEESHLRRVLEEIKTVADVTLPARAYNPDWVRSLLQASDVPGALGRLDTYEVTEVIGHGGMGVVLKAHDPLLKRWVAIKVLAAHLAHDDTSRRRFAREAQAAAAVRHEHVITIHAVSETNGLPYLVMEHVAGGSLHDYLECHGPPDWRVVARLGAEIASGLAAAHATGQIHRDIKPSNLLLQTEGRVEAPGSVKIGDFGLARVADEGRLTQPGIVAGTPMYMSPEQAMGEPLDERADLFSLGSVLYALCTGCEPFEASSPMAVLRRVCETTPRPIRELNPAVPAWLAATVERLHAKRPAGRFACAAEVAELLRYNLEHPEKPRLPPPARGWGRRRYWIIGGAVAAVLLLAGGLKLSQPAPWAHWAHWGAAGDVEGDRVPLRLTLTGHTGPVWSAAFAPDGLTLATGGDDSTIRLWDPATGREKTSLSGHGSAVLAVAFSHSGKFLVSGGGDGSLRLWDGATWAEGPPLLRQNGTVRRAPISPDDRTVAVANSTQGVELWDLEGRRLRSTLAGHGGSIMAIAFAPDGQTLATGDTSGLVRLWDPAGVSERASFRGDPLAVRALAFTPDGRTLVSAGNGDKDVKLWKVATQEQVGTLTGHENVVLTLAVSSDGRLLATGSRDGIVKIWDLSSENLLATLHAHQGSVLTAAFSPDGSTLVTGGEDRLVKLWDTHGLGDAAG